MHQVARWHAVQSAAGRSEALELFDDAQFQLRRRGSPYVSPRLWSAIATTSANEEMLDSVRTWAQQSPLGEVRCGVGRSVQGEQSVITLLQVDVLADVLPLATRVVSGAPIQLEARLLTPATSVSLVALPPGGSPVTRPTTLRGENVRAKLFIDQPGTWTLQLMGTFSGGPRPIAQILLAADAELAEHSHQGRVPGEQAVANDGDDPAARLYAMLLSARAELGYPPLQRNRTLDRVAEQHSRAMQRAGRLAHDLGQGNPTVRVASAGVRARASGENVARAGSVARLHRALWNSPSHRENLLLRRWDETGLAVVEQEVENGTLLYATQLFIDR